jgi:hypothetical protein
MLILILTINRSVNGKGRYYDAMDHDGVNETNNINDENDGSDSPTSVASESFAGADVINTRRVTRGHVSTDTLYN